MSGLPPKGSSLPKPVDLYKASCEGNLNRVKELVEGPVAHLDVNLPYIQETDVDDGFDVLKTKLTALQGAAQHGKLEVVTYLLEKGAKDFNEAVVAALETRKFNVAKLIFENPKFTTLDGNCLHHLYKYGTVDIVQHEIEKRGIDVSKPIDAKFGLPIFVALEQPNVSVIEYLINTQNVDPNSKNKLGQSVLLKVCLSLTDKYSHAAYTQIVATLINKGAKATEAYSDGFWKEQDILDVVCARAPDCKDIMIMLLDAGAPLESPRGRIHELAHHEDSKEVIQLFLDRGAKADYKNVKGHLCIHPAAMYGQAANVEFLVKKCGIDINALTEDGKTCVDLAGAKKETVAVLEKLGGKKAAALK